MADPIYCIREFLSEIFHIGFESKNIQFIIKHISVTSMVWEFMVKCHPLVRLASLAFYITYVVCVKFIHEWFDLQFKHDSERQIFEKLFMTILLTLNILSMLQIIRL